MSSEESGIVSPAVTTPAHPPATFDQREVGVHLVRSVNGHVQLRVSVQIGQREAVLQNQLASLHVTTRQPQRGDKQAWPRSEAWSIREGFGAMLRRNI